MSNTIKTNTAKKKDVPTTRDLREEIVLFLGILFLFATCLPSLDWSSPVESSGESHLYLSCQSSKIILLKKNNGNEQSDVFPKATPYFFLPIPINQAGPELLATIPGVGPVLALNIIKTRKDRGLFDNINDLLKIKGVGAKRANDLLKFITFAM